MRNLLFIGLFAIAFSFGLFSCGMNDILPRDDFSEATMMEALKEALILGSKTAASNLGDSSCDADLIALEECTKGYLGNKLVEIILPDTVANVLSKISSFSNNIKKLSPGANSIIKASMGEEKYNSIFGLDEYAKDIKNALNRGAEKAAPESKKVFADAIFGMSFSDTKEILFGDSIAATSYLEATTYEGLKSAFAPIIKEPLDLLKPNKYWEPLASNYNSFANAYSNLSNNINSNALLKNALGNSALPSLPYSELPKDISSVLSEYATGKALDGLFLMVGKQEAKLRADPWGTVYAVGEFITDAVGDLLGKVFSSAKE